jgi:hypothetical protein
MTRVQFLAQAGIFLFTTTSRLALGPTQPPFQWELGSSSCGGVKQQGREAEHSPPSGAKVKNMWNHTSMPPYVLMAWYLIKHRVTTLLIMFML